jgi:hypothetical protein
MPDDLGLLHTQRFGEVMNPDSSALHIQTAGRDLRVADAGQVGRDDGETLGQSGDDRPPHARSLRVAVQEDERRTAAGGQVVQFGATDLGNAGDDCLVRVFLWGVHEGLLTRGASGCVLFRRNEIGWRF